MTDIIDIKGLSHSYGDVLAVDGIDLSVEKGRVVALLGPNGAGKTTMINVVITLLPIQKGQVSLAGYDLRKDPDKVRLSIGVVFQGETLDADMTTWETLEFHGRLYSIPTVDRRARIDELLDVIELTEKRDELVKNLSGGMKRRLEIARGLLTRPDVLFLDEPTVGLDPQTRHNIWDYIERVKEEGVTILLTTHYMDEADRLSDHIYIIDHGRIITKGTPTQLKDSIGEDMVYLSTDDDEKALELLSSMEEVREVKPSSKGYSISLSVEGSKFLPQLLRRVEVQGIDILNVSMKKPTLDDVFIYFTGRDLREGENATQPTMASGGMG